MKPITPFEIRIVANLTDDQLCDAADTAFETWFEDPHNETKRRTYRAFEDEENRRNTGHLLFRH